jgi:hypothetical protein
MAAILCMYEYKTLSAASKFACGIRQLHATPTMFSLPLGELKLKFINEGYVYIMYTIRDP